MTQTDKRILLIFLFIAMVSTVIVFITVQPSWEIIEKIIFPKVDFLKFSLMIFITIVLSAIWSASWYKNGMEDSVRTTRFMILHALLEEIIVTFNGLMIVKALAFSFWEIIIFSLVLAFVFTIFHGSLSPKFFVSSLFRFYIGLYWGIIPAVLGHMASNLGLRIKIRHAQGWLFDSDDE